MSYRILPAEQVFWRLSNQMGVSNADLAKQLEATTLGARLWRLDPGQASTRHRHRQTHELYVLLEGTGRIRVGRDLHTLRPLSSLLIEPGEVRQLFNDTDADQLWLVVGAPPEPANTLKMTAEELAWLYPDGPKALPPELEPATAGRTRSRSSHADPSPRGRPPRNSPHDVASAGEDPAVRTSCTGHCVSIQAGSQCWDARDFVLR